MNDYNINTLLDYITLSQEILKKAIKEELNEINKNCFISSHNQLILLKSVLFELKELEK